MVLLWISPVEDENYYHLSMQQKQQSYTIQVESEHKALRMSSKFWRKLQYFLLRVLLIDRSRMRHAANNVSEYLSPSRYITFEIAFLSRMPFVSREMS